MNVLAALLPTPKLTLDQCPSLEDAEKNIKEMSDYLLRQVSKEVRMLCARRKQNPEVVERLEAMVKLTETELARRAS